MTHAQLLINPSSCHQRCRQGSDPTGVVLPPAACGHARIKCGVQNFSRVFVHRGCFNCCFLFMSLAYRQHDTQAQLTVQRYAVTCLRVLVSSLLSSSFSLRVRPSSPYESGWTKCAVIASRIVKRYMCRYVYARWKGGGCENHMQAYVCVGGRITAKAHGADHIEHI